jgi:hypothetical protein
MPLDHRALAFSLALALLDTARDAGATGRHGLTCRVRTSGHRQGADEPTAVVFE